LSLLGVFCLLSCLVPSSTRIENRTRIAGFCILVLSVLVAFLPFVIFWWSWSWIVCA
jgi:hypothetical protein